MGHTKDNSSEFFICSTDVMKTGTEHLLDAALTIGLFSPFIVFYWSGTWQLLDIYLLPGNQTVSACVSLSISVVILGTTFFIQDVLNKHITPEKYVLYIVVTRFYTYVTAFGFVNNWRGMWMLLDEYTGVTLSGAVINMIIGVIGLVLLRSYRNVLGPPGAWILDVDAGTHFTVVTRFRTQKGGLLYVLDVVFGVVVLSSLVLLVWRGKWQLLQFIPLGSDLWRAVIKSTAAHVMLCILCIIQYPARRLAGRLHTSSPWLQVVFENVFVFISCYTAVLYWQGMWNLLSILLVDFDQRLTQWPVHILGFGGLMVLCLCTTLQFSGFFIDGEFSDGLGLVVTPTYVRTFWMKDTTILQDLTRSMHEVNTGTECSVIDGRDIDTPSGDRSQYSGSNNLDETLYM